MGRTVRDSVSGTVALTLLAVSGAALAAATPVITATVVDMNGDPVPEVAVMAHPTGSAATPRRSPGTATLVQENRAFVPHILIVQTGTVVSFPNHDEFLHHVYSFSEAKRFEFPLYGGSIAPALEFDVSGIVTLGCNIHDSMVGYIVVTDAPYFALTDADGRVRFDELPAGDYVIEAWTPRLRSDRLPEPIPATVGAAPIQPIEIAFTSKLRPPYRDGASPLTWDRY